MKKIISTLGAFFVIISLNAQEVDTVYIKKNADTTNFMIGKKEISIIDRNGETDIKVKDRENAEEDSDFDNADEDLKYGQKNGDGDWNWHKKSSGKNFKGHWDALQIGINSYVTEDMSTSLPQNMDFMSLNTNKSININLNMFQQSFGLIGNGLGVVSGLGLEFSNYVFDGNHTIDKDPGTGVIIPVEMAGVKLDKSKLTTTYLTVPLLLEFQFPGERRSNRLYINGGVVGAVKLGSHTKIKYKQDGDKQDKKNKNDFNLNSLRYGFTGRVGIKHLSIFGTYYPVMLFEKNKGPELYPFMVGFSFDGF